jgi:hypothetical protein
MFASGMLEVECYNVFLKHWAKSSRKNVGEGIARLNALCQEVWLDGLTLDSLRPPASMSKTHIHLFVGKGHEITLNDREAFAGAVSLIEERWPQRVPAVFARLLAAYRGGVYRGEPLAFKGPEDGGSRLTPAEQSHLFRGLTWREFTEVHIRGVEFRSRKARKTVNCNTGIMYPYREVNGRERTMYGELRRIFSLPDDAFPELGGARARSLPPLLDVEWLVEDGAPLHGGRMPQVNLGFGHSGTGRCGTNWVMLCTRGTLFSGRKSSATSE